MEYDTYNQQEMAFCVVGSTYYAEALGDLSVSERRSH